MNWTTFWKSAAVQLVSVAALSALLAILLPRSFFESWGWLSGPTAWMLCAAVTAAVVSLPLLRTLLGAALAGLPSILFVVVGLHWLGALCAAFLFAGWCGWFLAGRDRSPAAI
jgi:hypothetical protein